MGQVSLFSSSPVAKLIPTQGSQKLPSEIQTHFETQEDHPQSPVAGTQVPLVTILKNPWKVRHGDLADKGM